MEVEEQESWNLEIARDRMRDVAMLAIKALSDDDIKILCGSEEWFMDHLADVIMHHVKRAK